MKVLNNKVPVKVWTDDIEEAALQQLNNLSELPFIHKHIACMPDVHAGYGSTVGSVIATKGAVRARRGDLGIIPGSMGQRSYIVEGLGNPESFNSCSHGAGRVMSRTKARNTFTKEDLINQTEGVECRKDIGVIDEIPGAYKDIDEVMENQKDLVKPLYILKQVICVKG